MKKALKVLAIDDEESIRVFITSVLEMEGYEVVTASNAMEGIQKTFSEVPDVVLTDMRMPVMDGMAYIKRIRAQIPSSTLPVIVVSGFGQEADVASAFKAGATDYIVKPFDFTDLLQRIQVALGKRISPDNIRYSERRSGAVRIEDIGPGAVIDNGKYGIIGEIASGGMGTVYLAQHLGYGSEVALKVLNPVMAGNREYVLRFLREMRIAVQMEHPSIVKVFDVGTSGDVYYYAMERLPRRTLEEEISANGAVAGEELAELGLQISSGLAYMHRRGFMHRDVKPGNIIVCGPGEYKLVDFGLACSIDDERLTKEGTFMGTPGFVPPESIAQYQAPSFSGDIYSLGATLYFAGAGRQPYDEVGKVTLKLKAQVHVDLAPLNVVNPALPQGLSEAVGKMMSRDPSNRFRSMAEVQESLSSLRPAK